MNGEGQCCSYPQVAILTGKSKKLAEKSEIDQGILGNETGILCFEELTYNCSGLEDYGHEQDCTHSWWRFGSVIHTSLAECETMCKSREDKGTAQQKVKAGECLYTARTLNAFPNPQTDPSAIVSVISSHLNCPRFSAAYP